MTKRIIFKELDRTRTHPMDGRIKIEENVLRLVKTIGFNHISKEQDGLGYIWFTYVMSHHQTYLENGRLLDSWVDLKEDKEDYDKRKEDFKKLMKDIDVNDDEIFGPYDRDKDGKKLIGDVHEHHFQENTMGQEPFDHLCRRAEQNNWLIEIKYKEEEDK